MEQKTLRTEFGVIRYYTDIRSDQEQTLVFLPGLTADHRFFEKQAEFFSGRENLLIWDVPGHGESRPFTLNFTLADKAMWLERIFEQEGICSPVIIGEDMSGRCIGGCFPGNRMVSLRLIPHRCKRNITTASKYGC